ncbi:MAG TPA: extracellular solute-binding protein [Candidatus Latescibacteria bacterium]|nr:extracellular solute-binding protein [Candidatus Latescibacterota bacterium]
MKRALVALLALSSCSSGGGSGRAELVYWSAANVQEVELAEKLTEMWNEGHPQIHVVHLPIPESRSSEEVLLAAVAARTTPDICSVIWPGVVEQFVRAGALVRLDTFPDFFSVMESRVGRKILEQYRSSDGGFYQVPWKTNPILIEYNKELFEEAGIERPPRTYSEFLKAGEKVTKDLDGDGIPDRWMMFVSTDVRWWQRFFDFYAFYIAASGGRTLLEGGEVDFEDSAAVQVFRFFREGFERGIFPRSGFQVDAFLGGFVAAQVTGPWSIPYLEKYKPEGFRYDFMEIPVPDGYEGPVYTYGDPKNIVIFSTCGHPRRAWEFVKYLISDEADRMLLEVTNQLPIRRNLLEDPKFSDYFKKNPMMVKFARQVPHTRGVDLVPELKEIFDAISMEFEATCIYSRKSPEEGIRDAAERCRQILME